MGHIVRNCYTERCSRSLHGHSVTVEIFLESEVLDRGHMVYDFGLLKGTVKDLVDSFDHCFTYWALEDPEFVAFIHRYSARWVELPVNVSCEQMSRVLFLAIDLILKHTEKTNCERFELKTVRVHETATGYAESTREDAEDSCMGIIRPTDIVFSEAVQKDWRDPSMWSRICTDFTDPYLFRNPEVTIQIEESVQNNP